MKTFLTTCAALAIFCVHPICAQELTLGSDAPKLEIQKFIKGEEVKKFEKGKIYVVELWATWCGPCRQTIPHLTELQKKYENVTFIGVAVLEDDPEAVAPFVEEMGKKMDYRVAIDLVPEGSEPNEGKFVTNWMKPAELPGIPSAFIINGEQKIAWIGHPAEMEDPLDQIVEGKYDLAAAIKQMSEVKAMQKKIAAINEQLQKLFMQFSEDGKPDELLAALDSAAKDLPEQAAQLQLVRFKVLTDAKDRGDDALDLANKLLESEFAEDPKFLDKVAWVIVNPDREKKADPKLVKFALKVALKADQIAESEDISVADTLAKAYFDNGDFANAVKAQQRCLKLAEDAGMAADPGLKKRLNQYKRALDNSKPKDDGASSKSSKK